MKLLYLCSGEVKKMVKCVDKLIMPSCLKPHFIVCLSESIVARIIAIQLQKPILYPKTTFIEIGKKTMCVKAMSGMLYHKYPWAKIS